ncbi:plastocyanin [Halorubrum alkaliphilum]|uniref:Plastocyanin n=1 Tax=Halorubrum alkaliphilum TaxID=261290 RepID=A0A8T4GE87_9EURY|nr:cohesin domain-containing protein [Halorubrum alkaliphilum]MBP1922453.1 plastocyanin [Halorubrum alkaliphilum]
MTVPDHEARSRRERSRVTVGISVLVLICGVLAVGLVAPVGPAAAGDNPGLLGFDPAETEVDRGDTVEVNVWFRAMAGYSDDGVASYEYAVAYDPELLTAVDVEPGPWLERGEETTVSHETDIDEAAGLVTVAAERDPPAGGVGDTAEDRTPTATITFEVAPDAPATETVVGFESADAQLLQYPLPVLTDREAVVEIGSTESGGTEADGVTPDAEDGATGGDDPSATTVAAIIGLGLVAVGTLAIGAVRRLR